MKAFYLSVAMMFGTGMAVFAQSSQLVDRQAEKNTRQVYQFLMGIENEGKVLIGHQDDLAYGVGWKDVKGGSDVKGVCGDYPAVYGWELGDLEHADAVQNLDTVNFRKMKGWIKEGYKRGGIITLSWHMDNFHTGGSAWDTTAAVRDILPGGPQHDAYTASLDRFADFVGDLKAGGFLKRKNIPILFRPFHEHTGFWFWWGNTHVTPDEYKALWQFTVRYLRDVKGLHNLIYVFNTDENFLTEEDYLRFYPGDEWVDMLTMDSYGSVKDLTGIARLKQKLQLLREVADRKGKPIALAETGYMGIPQPDWWTQVLLQGILPEPGAKSISYVLFWRNANDHHYFGPYPNQVSAADFRAFYRHPVTIFEKEVKPLSRQIRKNRKTTPTGPPLITLQSGSDSIPVGDK